MRDRGIDRVRSAHAKALERGQASQTAAGVTALKSLVAPVADAFTAFIAAEAARPGAKHTAFNLLRDMDPHVVAYLALRTAIDRAGAGTRLTASASQVGMAIESEIRVGNLAETEPGLWITIQRNLKQKTHGPVVQDQIYRTAARRNNIPMIRWSPTERTHVGMLMIDLIMKQTQLLTVDQYFVKRNKSVAFLRLSKAGLTWLTETNDKAALMRPAYAPTVVPPLPWRETVGGGYSSEALDPLPLVKRTFRPHVESLKAADLTGSTRPSTPCRTRGGPSMGRSST